MKTSYHAKWEEFLQEELDLETGIPIRDDSAKSKKQNTPQNRKDRLFPGVAGLSQLARGIFESQEGYLLIQPNEIDEEEVKLLLLDENTNGDEVCPASCVSRVLNLMARLSAAQKGKKI